MKGPTSRCRSAPKSGRTLIAPLAALALALQSAADPGPAPSGTVISPAAREAAERGADAFARRDYETARASFQKMRELLPDHPMPLVNLGTVEYHLHKLDEAEALLKRAIRIDPDIAMAWITLGIVQFDQQKFDAALAALTQAVLLEPKNARAHNYLGVTIGQKGWRDGAEKELRLAIELDPEYADAHFNLALLYLNHSSPSIELARRHYERAMELGAARDPLLERQLVERSDKPDGQP